MIKAILNDFFLLEYLHSGVVLVFASMGLKSLNFYFKKIARILKKEKGID